MTTKSLLIIFCLSLNINIYSQTFIAPSEKNYHIQVKQYNEFVDRFNFKTDFKGNVIDSTFESKVNRYQYIELLFNNENNRINSEDEDFSQEFIDLKKDFINEIVTSNYYIEKYSAKIIAEARSNISYKDKNHTISIFLNQEILNNGIKWVIYSVKGEIFNVLKQDSSLLRFIPPTSNETNFISLKRALDDKHFQQYYVRDGYSYDPLSAFLFAINTDLIEYNHVDEIIYHILDIPGWCIKLKEFIRDTENSGWLIDDIRRLNSLPEEYLDVELNSKLFN